MPLAPKQFVPVQLTAIVPAVTSLKMQSAAGSTGAVGAPPELLQLALPVAPYSVAARA